jgi:hypothetical protein
MGALVEAERPASEGARLLAVVRGEGKGRMPLKAMAFDLDASPTFVWHLLNGFRQPSLAMATRMLDLWGIRPEAWCRKPAVQKLDSTGLSVIVTLVNTARVAE